MEKEIEPTILVIVGISGDLASRKLLPALSSIAAKGLLPDNFKIIGTSRRELTKEEVLPKNADKFLIDNLELIQLDPESPSDYQKLSVALKAVEVKFKRDAQRIFYLSVPADAILPIISNLGSNKFNKSKTVLLLEKPFGANYESAEYMINHIHRYFSEDQIYRIDHFLAKEMAQNLLVFRNRNSLFKRTWNKDFIESIDIIASEEIGIEGRSHFYEQTGAMRDVTQSHLMQLAALTLMDLPSGINWLDTPKKRHTALKQLRIARKPRAIVRGQYKGYKAEVQNPDSTTETFLSVELRSYNSNWRKVPIRLTTGKALNKKTTEIRIKYHQNADHEANELILKIQPDEGVQICMWVKEPGMDNEVKMKPMSFKYDEHFDDLPEAYERVFVDAISGDNSLFASSGEILEAWNILKPLQKKWLKGSEDLVVYEKGSSISDVLDT